MKKLSHLRIYGTDISKGLEYLPENLEEFGCNPSREGAGVETIYREWRKKLAQNKQQKQEDEGFYELNKPQPKLNTYIPPP
jgi:hypothetical protein